MLERSAAEAVAYNFLALDSQIIAYLILLRLEFRVYGVEFRV